MVAGSTAKAAKTWPDLPYSAWQETRDTLHLCTRVATAPQAAMSSSSK